MMLIPCGPSAVPTGGAGVACPARIWIFTIAPSLFFAISLAPLPLRYGSAPPALRLRSVRSACSLDFARSRRQVLLLLDGPLSSSAVSGRLELGDLAELELYGGLAAEDVHEDGELRPGDVDVGDRAVEVGERPRGDAYLLARLELEARTHLLLLPRLHLAHPKDGLDLLAQERRRSGAVA